MAGRMGGKSVTVKRLQVLQIDAGLNCLFVRGAVPGHDNQVIRITDSPGNKFTRETAPPFPTFIRDPNNPVERVLTAPDAPKDASVVETTL